MPQLAQLYRELGPLLLAYFRRQRTLTGASENLLQDPFVRAEAAEATTFATAVALVREATASGVRPCIQSLSTPTWPRRNWRPRRAEWLRLAACLALGAGLGWSLRPLPQPPPATVTAVSSRAETTATTLPLAVANPPSHFWSISARIAAARQAAPAVNQPPSPRSLFRPSLLKLPQPKPQS